MPIPEIDVALLGSRAADLRHLRSDRQWAVPSSVVSRPEADVDRIVVIGVSDDALSPTLERGDHVIVDTARVEPGKGLFLVNASHHLICRLKAVRAGIELSFDNAAHAPRVMKKAELEVLGQVVGYFRMLGVS